MHARGAKGVRLDCQRGRRRRRRLRREGKRAIRRRLDSAPARRARRLAVARRVAQAPPCREHEPGRHVGGLRARRREKHRKAAPEAGGRASAPALAVEQRRERWSAARARARARQPRRWRVREARAVPRNVFRGRVRVSLPASRPRRRRRTRRRRATRRARPDARSRSRRRRRRRRSRDTRRALRASLRRGRVAAAGTRPRAVGARAVARGERLLRFLPGRVPIALAGRERRPRPSARRRPGRSGRRALRECAISVREGGQAPRVRGAGQARDQNAAGARVPRDVRGRGLRGPEEGRARREPRVRVRPFTEPARTRSRRRSGWTARRSRPARGSAPR